MSTFPLDAAFVLAGGAGKRLWPWSGPDLPKPLLPLGGGGRTLLAATLDRLEGLVAPGGVRLLAPASLAPRLAAAEPRAAGLEIWHEPSPRDTGPAIALAMRRLLEAAPDAVAAVLPADHRVEELGRFRAALSAAAGAARRGELVLLGVLPDRPATGFGYVVPAARPDPGRAVPVARFTEKPERSEAERLIAGGALWNAGLFVWRARSFWEALVRHAPEVAHPVEAFVASGRGGHWEAAPRLSIDYALMERARGVSVVPLDAGWDDVGGWEAVLRLARRGDAGPLRAAPLEGAPEGSVVLWVGEGTPPRALGMAAEPLLVVKGPHGLLVVPRDRADAIKDRI